MMSVGGMACYSAPFTHKKPFHPDYDLSDGSLDDDAGSSDSDFASNNAQPFDRQDSGVVETNTADGDSDGSIVSRGTSAVDFSGKRMINKYVVDKKIGQGKNGTVYRCHINTGNSVQRFAMKRVLRQSREAKNKEKYRQLRLGGARNLPQQNGHVPVVDKQRLEQGIRREIAIMKKCRHPHVVQLYEIIDDPLKNYVYLVMEYLQGGTIEWQDNDKPTLGLRQTRRIIRDAILGLEYLHHMGIIHRDIKPANLVYTKHRKHVKIVDFGTSISLSSDSPSIENAGTPAFMAPELVWNYRNGPEANEKPEITKAIDIWSLGVTLYCFLFGHLPFRPPEDSTAMPEFIIYNLACNTEWEPEETMGSERVSTTSSAPLLHLLGHMLEKHYLARSTLPEIKKSPWCLEDLPDPTGWHQDTSPAPINPSTAETNVAVSSLKFSWGNRITSIIRNVRNRRSIDTNDKAQPSRAKLSKQSKDARGNFLTEVARRPAAQSLGSSFFGESRGTPKGGSSSKPKERKPLPDSLFSSGTPRPFLGIGESDPAPSKSSKAKGKLKAKSKADGKEKGRAFLGKTSDEAGPRLAELKIDTSNIAGPSSMPVPITRTGQQRPHMRSAEALGGSVHSPFDVSIGVIPELRRRSSYQHPPELFHPGEYDSEPETPDAIRFNSSFDSDVFDGFGYDDDTEYSGSIIYSHSGDEYDDDGSFGDDESYGSESEEDLSQPIQFTARKQSNPPP